MAYWTITCKELPETTSGRPKSFSVMLDTDKNTWSGLGEHLSAFMSAKSGKYTFQQSRENGLKLEDSGRNLMATFNELIASTAVGATGSGKAERAPFNWKLDSK